MKCSKTCGHCSAATVCSPLNGTCSAGCSSGYLGDMCDKGNHCPTICLPTPVSVYPDKSIYREVWSVQNYTNCRCNIQLK